MTAPPAPTRSSPQQRPLPSSSCSPLRSELQLQPQRCDQRIPKRTRPGVVDPLHVGLNGEPRQHLDSIERLVGHFRVRREAGPRAIAGLRAGEANAECIRGSCCEGTIPEDPAFVVTPHRADVLVRHTVARKDGEGRIPIVSILKPTDEWRDFITQNPGLSQLRRKIREFPEADLDAVAGKMVSAGLIQQTALLQI